MIYYNLIPSRSPADLPSIRFLKKNPRLLCLFLITYTGLAGAPIDPRAALWENPLFWLAAGCQLISDNWQILSSSCQAAAVLINVPAEDALIWNCCSRLVHMGATAMVRHQCFELFHIHAQASFQHSVKRFYEERKKWCSWWCAALLAALFCPCIPSS